MKGTTIRNSLVVFQFIVSIILIVSSIVVYKQFVYMQTKDLGFKKDNVIIVPLWRLKQLHNKENYSKDERQSRLAAFGQEVLRNPAVSNVTFTVALPGVYHNEWYFIYTEELRTMINTAYIDHDYFDVFGLEMVAGENFRKRLTIPQIRERVIINEAAANTLGLKNPVGKFIYMEGRSYITNNEGIEEQVQLKFPVTIIGVFKDFHNQNLREEIKPVVYLQHYKGEFSPARLAIRFLPGSITDNIAFLEKTWKKFGVEEPLEYSFFDKKFEALYNKEKKLAQVFTFFTILAIFIACLGIFGLAAFTAEQRTKEIGIRKVMGSSVQNIVETLSRIYLKLIIIALVFACPAGYLIMNKWLQSFAFHTKINLLIFLVTILVILVIVLSSVSYHSIKAALTNPARTLKYE